LKPLLTRADFFHLKLRGLSSYSAFLHMMSYSYRH
jgi:hypothetical protein